jgi:hypothetical protein
MGGVVMIRTAFVPGANDRVTSATTAGVSRNMQAGLTDISSPAMGGGDLNGTSALIIFHQSGTGIGNGQMARLPPNSGNYCGIV